MHGDMVKAVELLLVTFYVAFSMHGEGCGIATSHILCGLSNAW